MTIGSIAWVELKLQLRTSVYWVALVIIALYSLGPLYGAPTETFFLPSEWITAQEKSLTWFGIVLIFLIPSALARYPRAAPILWTTPLWSIPYISGKLLGVWLMVFSLGAINLVLQFLVRLPAWGQMTADTLTMIRGSLTFWVVGLFFISSVYFLLTVLVRGRPISAYILGAVYFILSFSARDVGSIVSFIPRNFSSDLVVYGPQSQLRSDHTLLYASLALLLSGLALLTYSLRDPQGIAHKSAQALLFAFVVISFGATIGAAREFMTTRSQVLKTASLHIQLEPLPENAVESVQVAARLDPVQGRINGTLTLETSQALPAIDFYVPAGLDVFAVTDCQKNTVQSIRLSPEMLQTNFSPRICLSFGGAWHSNLANYRGDGPTSPEEIQLYLGAYIGQNYGYLTPSSRWFPMPIGPYEWAASHDIEIALPRATDVVVSPQTEAILDEQWRTYRWSRVNGRPLIGLAAGLYHQMTDLKGRFTWVTPKHEQAAEQTIDFVMAFLEPINHLLHANFPDQFVETPLLRWPIVTAEFILVPERYFQERLTQAETDHETKTRLYGQRVADRHMFYNLIRGIMHGQLMFTDGSIGLSYFMADVANPSNDPSSGYIPLQEALIQYLVMHLVDDRFGTHTLQDVLEARILFSDRYLSDTNIERHHPVAFPDILLPTPPNNRGWAFNQMFAAFGRLEKQVGREQVIEMIAALLRQAKGGSARVSDWLVIIRERGGVEAQHNFENTYDVRTT